MAQASSGGWRVASARALSADAALLLLQRSEEEEEAMLAMLTEQDEYKLRHAIQQTTAPMLADRRPVSGASWAAATAASAMDGRCPKVAP